MRLGSVVDRGTLAPGDSGGAIVTGTEALGITSGSNVTQVLPCQTANIVLAPRGGTYSVDIPIQTILGDIDASAGGGVGAGIKLRTR